MSTPGQYPQPQQYPQQNPQQNPQQPPQQAGGYFPAQAQSQYPAPQAANSNLWGIVLAGAGAVLAIVGLILVLSADPLKAGSTKMTFLGLGLLIGGLVCVALWLAAMMNDALAKARK